MVRRGQNLRGPYGYVITQVYRKVPITINPAHRSRASQHPWLPERSTKLAVGASGTHRTPTTNRASTVAFYDPWWHTGMGILAPPSQGIPALFIRTCTCDGATSAIEPRQLSAITLSAIILSFRCRIYQLSAINYRITLSAFSY